MVIITREEFLRYEDVRQSGRTNMFLVNNVMKLSGLNKEQCIEIMKNYNNLLTLYGGTPFLGMKQ